MSWSNALQPYITNPAKYHPHTVIYYDENVSIIHDSFPKSAFHLLCLPRDKRLTKQNPTIAVTDAVKDKLQYAIDWCVQYIADQFNKKYDYVYGQEGTSTNIKDFIQIGVHSVPSMNNLHIHVITKDFNSVRLKNKKHYNSFNTPFFIQWENLPLKQIPDKKVTEQKYVKDQDLVCCYCGENFGNKFSQLKKHIGDEFSCHFLEK